MKKNWFTSLFTDKEWDTDLSKVCGFLMIIVGFVGFFIEKNNFEWMIMTGASLLGIAKVREG